MLTESLTRNSAEKPSFGYCPFFWSQVFIDVSGDVFFCCHRQPSQIGNLLKQPLANIWQGPIARNLRSQFVKEGGHSIQCIDNCVLLTKDEKSLNCAEEPRLRNIHIEHHEFCNIRCIMCYQKDRRRKRALPNDVLYKHIDFKRVDEVQLQGGEPFAYAPCIELFLRLSLDIGVPVTLQTNGLLLSDQHIDVIAASSNEIMISINAATSKTHNFINSGSSFVKVMNNIKKLQRRREQLNSRLKIEGHMTLVKENLHELPAFVLLAEKVGLDSVSISWEEQVPAFLQANKELFTSIRDDLLGISFWNKNVFLKKKHVERLQQLFSIDFH